VRRVRLAFRAAWITLVSFPETLVVLLLHSVRAPLARGLVRWWQLFWTAEQPTAEIVDLHVDVTPPPLRAYSFAQTAMDEKRSAPRLGRHAMRYRATTWMERYRLWLAVFVFALGCRSAEAPTPTADSIRPGVT
jgi:hypothetical protein